MCAVGRRVSGSIVGVSSTNPRPYSAPLLNVVRAGILWVSRPLRLEVVDLHIVVCDMSATVSAMTIVFFIHRNAGLFTDRYLFILAVLIVVKSSVRFNEKFFFFPSCITGFIIFARSKAYIHGPIIAALMPFANFAILAHCIIQRVLIQIAYNNASAAERTAFNFNSNLRSAISSSCSSSGFSAYHLLSTRPLRHICHSVCHLHKSCGHSNIQYSCGFLLIFVL